MASNFDNLYSANLIGLWDFKTCIENEDTGLGDGIAQDGTPVNNPEFAGGWLLNTGSSSFFKVQDGNDQEFDLSQGSIITKFKHFGFKDKEPDTVMSRGFGDGDGAGKAGAFFEIRVSSKGAVEVFHADNGQEVLLSTKACFAGRKDLIEVTYSWDAGCVQVKVVNQTKGLEFTASDDQDGMSLDLTDGKQNSFVFGARQSDDCSYDQHFKGAIDYVAVLDKPVLKQGDGIVEGTDGDDLIDLAYTGDPEGDRIDHEDAILPGEAPNDDIVEAGAGNDTVFAGEGSDEVYGGAGDDVIDTSGSCPLPDRGFPGYGVVPPIPADPDPWNDRDWVEGGSGNDLIFTGDDEDTVFGGAGDDTIDGGIDDDSIQGNEGDDRIVGGEGADTIAGKDGNDVIYGGLDPIFPDAFNIRDDGGSGPPDPDPGNGTDLIDGGSGNDTIHGQDDNDTILGGTGDDLVDGGIDDDLILGKAGNDSLLGGQGNDKILGGTGDDRIDLGGGDGGADRAFGDADADSFTGVGQGDYIDGGEAGNDFDTLDLTGSAQSVNPGGRLEVEYADTNPEDGVVTYFNASGDVTGTTVFYNIENVVPCFTPGTHIATPKGERRVEDLEIGDRIITRDNGIQEIRWLGSRTMKGVDLKRATHLYPVRIREGALGNGLPERDMLVSPNHRVLVASDKTALYFEDREVLVSAKHLTGLEGVEVAEVPWVTYIHFMFDQHEVVLSDGAWTESFQPGDQTLDGLGNAQRNEIYELFPELKTREGREQYQAARRSLKRHEANLLTH